MTYDTPGQLRRFLSVAAASEYSSLSAKSIRRLLAAGKLTTLRPVRGRVVIDRNELDALVLGSGVTVRQGRGKKSSRCVIPSVAREGR
jgi:hypothetical protein